MSCGFDADLKPEGRIVSILTARLYYCCCESFVKPYENMPSEARSRKAIKGALLPRPVSGRPGVTGGTVPPVTTPAERRQSSPVVVLNPEYEVHPGMYEMPPIVATLVTVVQAIPLIELNPAV